MQNVGRENKVLHGLLKDAGFKFSRRQDLWYLNSTWKPGTRDMKVMHLVTAAAEAGISFDIQDPGASRRMALLKEGDRIRISPGKAVIHGVDSFGMHERVRQFPEMIAEVREGRSVHRTPVQVSIGERTHRFGISHESGALELVSGEEAEQWKADIGSILPAGVSVDLDRKTGRQVRDLVPGQRVSLSGKEITLSNLKSYERQRYDDVTVLSVAKGPVEGVRYVLLEHERSRLWVEAAATDNVPVHEMTPVNEAGFRAPRFRIQHVNDVQAGEVVSATGLDGSNRHRQIVTATGAITGIHKKDGGDYSLTIKTAQGLVSVEQGEQQGYAPEVTTMTPGTVQAQQSGQADAQSVPGLDLMSDPLVVWAEDHYPSL